jgi:hypothetical protein
VSGDVVRWRKDEERPERVDAVEYIELLEGEVEELRKQLEMRGRGKNELLEYLKSLQPQNLQVNRYPWISSPLLSKLEAVIRGMACMTLCPYGEWPVLPSTIGIGIFMDS